MEEYHEFVIVGGGIAAMQAGMILAHYNYDFVILEAASKLGGRIATDLLADVVEEQPEEIIKDLFWLKENIKLITLELHILVLLYKS